MSLFANILGFATFGLAARFGQLGIQKRNLFSSQPHTPFPSSVPRCLPLPCTVDPGGHLVAMATFGFAGYWAYQWDIRAAELLADKRAEILKHRRQEIAKAEQLGASQLSEE